MIFFLEGKGFGGVLISKETNNLDEFFMCYITGYPDKRLFMITMTTPSCDCWRYKLHQSKSANLFLCPTPRRICIVFLDIISSGSVHSIACWVVTSICWIISNNAIMSWPWIQSTFKYMECLTGYLWSKKDIH